MRRAGRRPRPRRSARPRLLGAGGHRPGRGAAGIRSGPRSRSSRWSGSPRCAPAVLPRARLRPRTRVLRTPAHGGRKPATIIRGWPLRRLHVTITGMDSTARTGSGRDRALIAVYGSSTVREGQPAYRTAYDLGQALARAGADVMTGGYGGIMEACSRGAAEA